MQLKKEGKIAIWIIVLIVVVVAVIAGLLVLGTKYPQQKAPKTSKESSSSQKQEKTENAVYAYNGVITEIKKNEVIFLAKPITNLGLTQEVKMTAQITPNTQFLRIEKPKVLPGEIKPGESASLFTREEISFSDLKVGDKITAISSENIRGKTKFPVVRIEVTSTK